MTEPKPIVQVHCAACRCLFDLPYNDYKAEEEYATTRKKPSKPWYCSMPCMSLAREAHQRYHQTKTNRSPSQCSNDWCGPEQLERESASQPFASLQEMSS